MDTSFFRWRWSLSFSILTCCIHSVLYCKQEWLQLLRIIIKAPYTTWRSLTSAAVPLLRGGRSGGGLGWGWRVERKPPQEGPGLGWGEDDRLTRGFCFLCHEISSLLTAYMLSNWELYGNNVGRLKSESLSWRSLLSPDVRAAAPIRERFVLPYRPERWE